MEIIQSTGQYQRLKLEQPLGIWPAGCPELPEYEYTADLLAWRTILLANGTATYEKVDFEIDGSVGHDGKISTKKDKRRDAELLEHGIRTVRIATRDLIGKHAFDDATILQDIEWQLAK